MQIDSVLLTDLFIWDLEGMLAQGMLALGGNVNSKNSIWLGCSF